MIRPTNPGRRKFLQKAGSGLLLLIPSSRYVAGASKEPMVLSPKHKEAVHRSRRIVMMQDAYGDGHGATPLAGDFESWLKYRFSFVDELKTQIDAIWWDMAAPAAYPNRGFAPDVQERCNNWLLEGHDPLAALVEGTHRRGLEAFFNHRISEVELDGKTHRLKKENPDWVLPTWWPHGMWNLAAPGLQDYKLKILRHLAENYDFDGIQVDFARHTPCLPPGRQWELRDHLTQFIRRLRISLLERAKSRGRPYLLAVRVPRNIEGCRVDGFDVETWARERLVDIFTIGTRSIEVDVADYKALGKYGDIKVQPCWDDHHASDAYQWQSIEFLRGVFSNWWQQGADSVVTWNWSNATPETCRTAAAAVPGPDAHMRGFEQLGSLDSMRHQDKIFAVDRRGAFPWAEGYFSRNQDALLPLKLTRQAKSVRVPIRVQEPVAASRGAVKAVKLRVIVFGAEPEDGFEVRFNERSVDLRQRDPKWKDSQIFSPKPQPNSGGAARHKVDPDQKLLRLDYALDPGRLRPGINTVELSLAKARGDARIQLEKLEIHVDYA
jgi:hypothetical protein